MNSRILAIIGATLVFSTLTACTSTQTSLRTPETNSVSTYFGKVPLSVAALIGVDSNFNGVTDEVENTIVDKWKGANPQSLAALRFARAINANIVSGALNLTSSRFEKSEFMTAQDCLAAELGSAVASDMVTQIVNTDTRRASFNRWIVLSEPLPSPTGACSVSFSDLSFEDFELEHTQASSSQ